MSTVCILSDVVLTDASWNYDVGGLNIGHDEVVGHGQGHGCVLDATPVRIQLGRGQLFAVLQIPATFLPFHFKRVFGV